MPILTKFAAGLRQGPQNGFLCHSEESLDRARDKLRDE